MNATQDQWLTCIADNDYEINDVTFQIRRISNHRVVAETYNNGYIKVALNRKTMCKHRVIALQFIPNDDPEHKTQVDHINHDRADNRLENLRWTTPSENSRNRTGARNNVSYTYVDEIDDQCIVIDHYGNRILEGYYYDQNLDQFYVQVGDRYRILHVVETRNGVRYIYMYDVENNKFKFVDIKLKFIVFNVVHEYISYTISGFNNM